MKSFLKIILGLFITIQLYFFVQVVWYLEFNPKETAFMHAEKNRLSSQSPPRLITKQWVPYEKISLSIKQAVIASEDANFTVHDGVDWDALEKAAKENVANGKIKRGGSTITMQLSKNLFLSAEQSYIRKAEEMLITGMLEVVLSKKRILEIYLNVAEWGVGIFGIEAAAKHYYGISASQLSPQQAAWLAAILPAPRRFDQMRNSPMASRKANILLYRMRMVSVP
ncbi:monofunctional biosynthetic peptidoglycan transglycosylase [Polynucleobacter sp. SHI8]|uniref:monofunctional biosynthetic peptidoglycan transglycosylase n=1 Tax=unclassified Polynucleobacter TaxID=2640945 RepID=UPI0024910CFC|nr:MULTISPECIES: monofunctional biosynthetic peptidoglycan transglycosylase [unclassified Polynucleobacter]BDW10697.1 monofunctional biosynthetic peptidoglycan transglycosylase [Polynucleobacter sp. SHI2]BDW13143.1 monofunctional biosynthetic peptidoglycan transglycosylase [Polynucleobacter sp. SHI8]